MADSLVFAIGPSLASLAILIALALGAPISLYTLFFTISNRRYFTVRRMLGFSGACFVISLPLCIAGVTSGYIAGISRIPAVTSLLPASLSFISAVVLLIHAAKNNQQTMMISCCVIVFCLALFGGTMIGASSREDGRVDRLKALSEQELQIRRYRKNRGLEPEFPSWLLTGEGIYK